MGQMSKIGDLIERNTMLQERFRVMERVGQGGFGQVYRGIDLQRAGDPVAIKTEMRMHRYAQHDPRRLIIEKDVLVRLRGKRHIPNVYASGKCENGCPYVVMQFLGNNLDSLRCSRETRRFSMSTTIRASQQVLMGLEYLHRQGFVHRDMKPGNTCIGKKDPRTVYIIDFGMCRRFYYPEKGVWRKPRTRAHFRGTYRYASVRTHLKKETGPADDLESWIYSFVEMGVKSVPWCNSGEEETTAMKKNIPLKELCRGAPNGFLKFAKLVFATPFDTFPNYQALHQALRSALISDHEYVRKYDWEMDGNDIDAMSED
ncbi:unnamed protein product [Bursaphelenchus xylophilus]|uniref:non-specific serine/threonine protein kinase n=1 Tax=Bursaphelenchus xylophilus TaxID=6326 RepID=A0A1I7RXB7_BURXY|nr:unnamed protein product [Bursaphelenchus xylophilus]CAG9121534.1 unnamed protein product [Bursaphelenchus xylophilus]